MDITSSLKAALRPFWVHAFVIRESLTGYPMEKRKFREKQGYDLDLENPRSLNQKIAWKKLKTRDPLLPVTVDKYRVRHYVRALLGEAAAQNVLIPLFHVTDRPETIPFDALPEEYVIKANHSFNRNILVQKGMTIDRRAIVDTCRKWLREPYGFYENEWAYQTVPRRIIVEKLLRDEKGEIPADYKLHVFHGKCRFIHTTFKKEEARTRSLFTPEWELLPVGWKHEKGHDTPPPPHLQDMIRIAETLGTPFEYVRVDLYNIGGHIYCGELTQYHGSGLEQIHPREFDFEFGTYWHIEPEYWKRRKPIPIDFP